MQRTVRRMGPHPRKVRVACPGCDHINYFPAHWEAEPFGALHDPWFGFSLWLQTSCAGHVLWAYNGRHLAFLRDYVAADLRERVPNANSSLASRLPRWIKAAKHRDAVGRGIARLEKKLR